MGRLHYLKVIKYQLLYNIDCKRTAGARAKGNVELCMLTKDDYNFILTQFPIISERIQRTIKEREENEIRKKAEQAALEAAKKLEEEREAQEKLARASRQKSTIFGSITSIASSIMSREHNTKILSKPDLKPSNRSFIIPGQEILSLITESPVDARTVVSKIYKDYPQSVHDAALKSTNLHIEKLLLEGNIVVKESE